MRLQRGVVLAATFAAVAAGSVTLPAAPAEGAGGRCAPGTGVTVVVDYGQLTDYTELGCDPAGADVAAKTVVPRAGFPLENVSGQPFVCRVKGLPDSSAESCGDTPPANAYWGLFWSDGTSTSWKYSSVGVNDLEVPEGGSIGWRFQDGGSLDYPDAAPTVTPAKPKPSPTPSKTPAPKPSEPTKSPTPAPKPSTTPPGTAAPDPSPSSSDAPGGAADGLSGDGRSEAPGGAGKSAGTGAGKDNGKRKDNGDDGRRGDRSPGKTQRDELPRDESAVGGSEVVALEPASGEPLTEEGSSTGLTILAGATVLLLGAAAGLIAWRRRV